MPNLRDEDNHVATSDVFVVPYWRVGALIQGDPAFAFHPDKDPSLVGCWKLDETSGTVAKGGTPADLRPWHGPDLPLWHRAVVDYQLLSQRNDSDWYQ